MADEDGGGGGKKKKLMMIVVLLLLLIGGGGAAYYFLFMPKGDEAAAGADGKEAAKKAAAKEAAATDHVDVGKIQHPLYTPAQEYNVNLMDRKHFLKIEMVAVLEDPKALEFLAGRKPIIDDMVLTLLSNKRTEDLASPAGQNLLRRQLREKANSVFTEEFIEESDKGDRTPVRSVLITKFILN